MTSETNLFASCALGSGEFSSFIATQASSPELVVFGKYESGDDQAALVRVTKKEPIILALSSYEPTTWTLELAPGAHVVRLLVSGAHAQTVAGAPPGVAVETVSKAYGYRWPSGPAGSDTPGVIAGFERATGMKLGAFGGCYHGTTFWVGDLDDEPPK
jgi:hypothetical protein